MKKRTLLWYNKKAIGGIFMPRKYRHIKEYEREILKLKEDGLTHRQIGDKLGFTKEQIKEFFKRYHKKQRRIEAGVALRKRQTTKRLCF